MGIMQRWKGRVYGALGQFKVLQFALGGALASLINAIGTASLNVTTTVNSGTTALQTLMSYSLPANALDQAGRSLLIKAWGTLAGNAQPKSVNLKFGGMNFQSGTSTQSGASWYLEGIVARTGASAQLGFFKGQIGTTMIAPTAVTDTSVDTGAITISATCQSGSGSSTDITQNGLLVEFLA